MNDLNAVCSKCRVGRARWQADGAGTEQTRICDKCMGKLMDGAIARAITRAAATTGQIPNGANIHEGEEVQGQ